ncbi:hypothetical protein DSOUD_1562 [Desulfuromonas soudanensis]|uniref:Restriction endonuclease n=1 Tax=Desulfuromonas soudanensis TaxID=1603606 RepID=A0A0M4CWH3_9BACT|nr:hypothetical protein [Desulfuromonas soudanensis]ALC16341.1 hypothetical protein DSOUD_1562 [Desulfuromonas soudanensis]
MRNENIEKSVHLLISLIDRISHGESLGSPAPISIRNIFDNNVDQQGGSLRLACAFLAVYSIVDKTWDFKSVPTGVRGRYGDKLLASELTFRNITFHKNITAFGENLGWKGAVRQFDLTKDSRFSDFLIRLKATTPSQRKELVDHIAWRLQSSRVIQQALPPLPASYLSYARSLSLCEKLIAIPSEGHIQQFLVAAFIEIHRRRFGHRVVTHHPHASDKFDGTKGDIEEFRDYELIAAYEVTVRNDWKNRLTDFGSKVSDGKLHKYVIFAANVRSDSDLHPATKLIKFVNRLSFDLAVVDLSDFFSVFCAELHREEIGEALNRAYELLTEPRLCGRDDFIKKFLAVTDAWLES